jgi:hypothetical protein
MIEVVKEEAQEAREPVLSETKQGFDRSMVKPLSRGRWD